jgi:hypothetical protein
MKRLKLSRERITKEGELRLKCLEFAFQFWSVTGRYDTAELRQVADLLYKYITKGV